MEDIREATEDERAAEIMESTLKWFEKKRALARAGRTEPAFDGAAAASAEVIEAESAAASGADGEAADTASPQ